MRDLFAGVVFALLVILGVFRVGFALQRIDAAIVTTSGPVCDVFGDRQSDLGAGRADDFCIFSAALAGRLDGGWTVTPTTRPDLRLTSRDVSMTYDRSAWRLAWGAAVWLPGLVIATMIGCLNLVMGEKVRRGATHG